MKAQGANGAATLQGRGAPQRAGRVAPGAGELLLWCLLLLLAVLLRAHVAGGPELSNDSYQYLSTAENLRRGAGVASSIAHFDAERSHGRLPAPLTTFAPGYPALTALVASAGLGLEQAAALVSLAATLAGAAMLAHAAGLLGTPAATVRVLLLLLLSSAVFIRAGNQIASEALFTALTLGALLLLLAAQSGTRSNRAYLMLQLGANALVAAAFCVRYAGLFLFAALAVFHAARWLAGRRRRALLGLAAMSLSALPIAAVLWRNLLLVGSVKGGNTKAADNPMADVLYRFVQSIHHLFLGDGPARLGIAEAGLALALLLLAAATLPVLWRRRGALLGDPRMQLIMLFLAVYVGAMVYLGARSVISFGPRMFAPLVPVLLLLAGGLWRHAAAPRRRGLRGAAALLVLAYAAVNLPLLLAERGPAPHERVAARLDPPLESLVPPEATLVSTEGQAAGYLLRRRTVSLASPHFSETHWTEEAVRAAMSRFHARHLLLCHEAGKAPSAFLAALEGRAPPPAWLQLLADNGRARLFVRREPR